MELYQSVLWVEIISAPIILISLLLVTAPYGRHIRKGWGFRLNTRLGWVLMELPAVLTILILYLCNFRQNALINVVFILIWEFHYLYRTFYFPFQIQNPRKSFPVSIVLFAIIFNIMNGYVNGYDLFNNQPVVHYSEILSSHFIIGLIVFIAGFQMHYKADKTIVNLRKNSNDNYSIPYGGMFKYVTNPNYLGEFIQWSGWAILTWSWAGFAFALFTFCNLFPRAIANHRWYKEKFPDYPEERKRFLPYVF